MNKKVNLVMPMGGGGTRFLDKGINCPKPLIEIKDKPFFYWSTESIRRYVELESLTFVVLKKHINEFKIDKNILQLYPEAQIICLDEVLPGAVLTCLKGVQNIKNHNPVIFNDCDHLFKCSDFYKYCNIADFDQVDGALLTFTSNDPKFSYICYTEDGKVCGTVEKRVASDRAICGAYYFKNTEIFKTAAEKYLVLCEYNEYFMSGLYNVMANEGKNICTFSVDMHVAFGTLEEYEKAIKSKDFEEF